MKIKDFFFLKISLKNQLNICFVMLRQYWSDIGKLKNVFRSTLNPTFKFQKFLIKQNFLLTNWLTDQPTDWLTPLLMPPDKHIDNGYISTGLI